MPRTPKPHWDKREQAYRSDAGGETRYFRGIARDDHVGIARAFGEHLEAVRARRLPAVASVVDVGIAFIEDHTRRSSRRRTIQSHRERLMMFCKLPDPAGRGTLGEREARSLRPADLRLAIAAWQKLGHSGHTVAGAASSVRAAFRWAATEEAGRLIPAYPFGEVKIPAPGRAPNRYAERSEVAAFLRFIWRRADTLPGAVRRRFARLLALMIRVAAYTGARPGGLASAWWSDFDPERGTITLPPDRHKTGHKTKRDCVFYLTPGLVRALLRERARPGRHPISIFTHQLGAGSVERKSDPMAGEPWGTFIQLPNGRPSFDARPGPLCRQIRVLRAQAHRLGRMLADAGRPTRGLDQIQDVGPNRFVMYRLRHTKASDDLMAGGNPATVAELLSTSVRMLETTYGHLQDDYLARAAADLARSSRSHGARPPGGASPRRKS